MSNKQNNHIGDTNKKISSVEWLMDNIFTKSGLVVTSESNPELFKLIEQAKSMHKEELIDFADDYVDNCVIPNDNMAIPTHMDVPEYYKTKFEK